MKRKSIWTLLATLLLALCAMFGVACGGGNGGGGDNVGTVTLSKTELGMNLYDEVVLTVEEEGTVTWSSSDETIVKVTADGLVIAQGVSGDAMVTAKIGDASASCKVMVRDRGISPILEALDARAFVNALVEPEIYVNYDDKRFTPESVTLTSSDPSIFTVEDGNVKGVSEGSATVEISATWKKATLEGEATVTVYKEHVILLAEETVNIYDVPDGTEAKNNAYTVQAEVFNKGVLVENAELTLKSDDANKNYVTLNGATVKVNPEYSEELATDGKVVVVVDVTAQVDGKEVSTELTVNVCPNYVVKETLKEITDTKMAAIELKTYNGEVGGRTGVVDYTITDVYKNAHASASPDAGSWINNIWANWNTRLEFVSTMTLNGISAYEFLKSEGYKLLSFDVYYQGHPNSTGELMQSGMFFGITGCSSYFYVDCQNNREDIMIVNQAGEITNTLKIGEWQTVYLDIDSLINSATIAGKSDCNLFLSSNHVGDVCYLDDVRYWYDTTVLDKYENKLDLEVRELTVDTENGAKASAPANEFIAYSPIYVSFAATELNGVACYKYDSAKPADFKAFDVGRRNKINAYNDLTGTAVKKGYKYITFDILVESGEPKIVYYDIATQKDVTLALKNDAVSATQGLKFFKNGVEVDSFTNGEWMSVTIRIDGKTKEAFNITSNAASVFYVKEVNYYEDESYVWDYSYNALLRASVDGLNSYYYVNDELNLHEYLDVRMKGVKTTEYTISSISGYDSIATYDEATGVLKATTIGETYISLTVEKDGHVWDAGFNLRIEPDNGIVIKNNKAELYGGTDEYDFAKTFEISARAYENKQAIESGRLNYEIVSGEGYITVNSNVVTAVKGNEDGSPVNAQVRVWFENADGTETSAYVDVVVFDQYRSRGEDEFVWGNHSRTDITYGAVEEEIGGRTGVSKYYSPDSNSWTDRLMIYESGHAIAGSGADVTIPYANHILAFNNLTEKNINYISFDIYFCESSLVRVQAPDVSGQKDQRNDYYADGLVNTKQDNENISIYLNGKELQGSDKIPKNTWVTIVIDHKTAILGNNSWTAIFLNVKGTVYLDDVRYYHDMSWMFDCAAEEVLTLDATLADRYIEGDVADFVPTVTYLKETVENPTVAVTVSNTDVATYDATTGKITFSGIGETEITASVTINGVTVERSWTVKSVIASRIEMEKTEFELWDPNVITGDKFPSTATLNPTVYINKQVVEGAKLIILNYTGDDVVTVADNVLTAKATGSAVVELAYEDNLDVIIEIKVDVYGNYVEKDGSELIVIQSTSATYTQMATAVGGRTGVYAFVNPSSASWGDRIAVYESAHTIGTINPSIPFGSATDAYNNMVNKGYNYVTLDVYFTTNSGIKISSATTNTADKNAYFARKDYVVGQTLNTPLPSTVTSNENITIYQHGVKVADTAAIEAGKWYTIVIDRVNTIDPALVSTEAWSAIDFAGCFGTVYFDAIRYYFNDACYTDNNAQKDGYFGYDGSEFVLGSTLNENSSYKKVTEGTYAGAYKFTSAVSGWKDKLSIYEANHIGTAVFGDAVKARANMLAKGYTYVTFDLCMEAGSIAISVPEYTLSGDTYTWQGQKYVTIASGVVTNKFVNDQRVKLYKDGVETSTYETGVWYTVVVEYIVDTADIKGSNWAGIDIASTAANTVIYLDDVRYYTENPFTA